VLEEDIALANVALDLIGQAANFLRLAGQVEGRDRDEDALAYFRDAVEYRNLKLVELPNGDYGHTIVRQFLFDAWQTGLYEALCDSSDTTLAAIAAKGRNEAGYHLRYSSGWLVRLGDGTGESHARVAAALERLWPFTGELFADDDVDRVAAAEGVGALPSNQRPAFLQRVDATLAAATLARPPETGFPWFGKQGRHSEHLGYLLAEMQSLHRAHPGATW
jgi:ring-1,2-phenylacetyl-CoA epoxidase subunit PaaC